MSLICAIDQTTHADRDALHKHIRKLKVKQEDYYTKYETRCDRLTGEPLPFKTVAQYLAAEFTNKNTMKKWVSTSPEGRGWAVNWLKKRKEEKGLTYAPTQVELRSLMCPSMHYYEQSGGYAAACIEVGLQPRFTGALKEQPFPADTFVIIDSREQKPLVLSVPAKIAKVNAGDYSLDDAHDGGVYIERKSLTDFVGTLSSRKLDPDRRGDESNAMRFAREIDRAKEVGGYLVVLVESCIDHALSFNHLPQFTRVNKTHVTPDHIFKNLRDLLTLHQNFQVLFVNGRKEAANAVVKLLAAGDSVKHTDLQFLYETKSLTF